MKADINITPLIDVLLVLLIIFMLVVPVAPSALDASLPESAREKGIAAPTGGVVLTVGRDAFSVDGVSVLDLGGLERRLGDALLGRRDHVVFVRVAQGVEYARVVDAIDVARGCGADRIGLVDAAEERN